MRHFLLLVVGCWFSIAGVQAQQFSQTNYSLQVGSQLRLLNPVSLNYTIDQFNTNRLNWDPVLSEVRWTNGLSVAAGMHRGRSEVRLQVQTFASSSFGIGPDSLGNNVRRDLQLSGQTYQLGLASQLIRINRNLNFGVGGAFAINRFVVRSASVAEGNFDPEAELPVVQSFLKSSINLIAPIHIGILPWLELNIEPTYQVFFGPANFSELSDNLNGTAVNSNDPRLEAELDHFGISVALIGYLRRRY